MIDAIPAATVIIVRDLPEGCEVLMIERHKQLAFAGGALVFPGGRIDIDDRRITEMHDLCTVPPMVDADDAAGRVAAIRESIEETGIPIGVGEVPHDRVLAWREALHKNTPFSELLRAEGVRLNLDSLVPFARWRPYRHEARVFDTRFYIAKACDDRLDLGEADGGETTRMFWISPQKAIAEADSGHAHIIFPTRRNLERVGIHSSHAALEAHARSIPVRLIVPSIEDRDGIEWLTIPDDLGYPVTGEILSQIKRG